MARVCRVRLAAVLAGSVLAAWLLVAGAAVAARDTPAPSLTKGARIGVLNLLDPEVTQFHGAKALQDSFRKTYRVEWSVEAMLSDAVQARLLQLGLTPVPLGVTDELDHAREACFLEGYFAKELPKDCVLPFQHLLAASHVEAVIVLGPGLNDSRHAGSSRRKDLPEDLRGWSFVSGEGAAPDGKPAILGLTELLWVGATPVGPVLRGREWGGNDVLEWSSYSAPPDLKVLSPEAFAQLQPLFAGLVSRQAARLLGSMEVKP